MQKKILTLAILNIAIISPIVFAQPTQQSTKLSQGTSSHINTNNNTTSNSVDEFIKKNDNILFYMEEAIKQEEITHDDYLVVIKRWKEIKQILTAFKKDSKKYNPKYIKEFSEQEELFADYAKTIYAQLVNQSALHNKLQFRFDVDNTNLLIMIPKVTPTTIDEFKRSNYLKMGSDKFNEILELGFSNVKLTDGKKTELLVKIR